MKFLVFGIVLMIVVGFTATGVYAELQVSERLTVISNTQKPVFEFRDQGSKAFFFQIPDGTQRLEIFDFLADKARLTITNAGNVGIGTQFPTTLLDLVGPAPTESIRSTAGDATLFLKATGGNPQVTFTDAGSSSYQLRIEDGTQKFQLFNLLTGNPSITIQNNGNVGIGTTTPAEKLDVAGNIKLSGDIVSDGDICIGSC